MARLLTSASEISETFISMIQRANKEIDIVTPYINFGDVNQQNNTWGSLVAALEKALERNVNLQFFTKFFEIQEKSKVTKCNQAEGSSAKDSSKPNRKRTHLEMPKAVSIFKKTDFHVFLVKFLHSKIYRSESAAILSSMNLELQSLQNKEIGVYFDDHDGDALATIKQYIDSLMNGSVIQLKRIAHCVVCGKSPLLYKTYWNCIPYCDTCQKKRLELKEEQKKVPLVKNYCYTCGKVFSEEEKHEKGWLCNSCFELYKLHKEKLDDIN